MNKSALQTSYVSEIDSFLNEFDRKHPAISASQQAEINKAKRIATLRDSTTAPTPGPDHKNMLWEEF